MSDASAMVYLEGREGNEEKNQQLHVSSSPALLMPLMPKLLRLDKQLRVRNQPQD